MELELTVTLDDDAKGEHCSQFSFSVDYDGDGVENAFLCSASPKQKLNTLKLLPFLHIPKPSIHFSIHVSAHSLLGTVTIEISGKG